jgi:hypothetical protein
MLIMDRGKVIKSHMYARTNERTYELTHACMYARTRTHEGMHTDIHARTHTHIHARTHLGSPDSVSRHVDDVINPARDPVVAVLVASTAVARNVLVVGDQLVLAVTQREVGLLESLLRKTGENPCRWIRACG